MNLADDLRVEFERRRALNPRYSLRALARSFHISHSSLSRLLRGRRPSPRSAEVLGRRLGWSDAAIHGLVAGLRVDRLRVLAATRGFIADARWLASRSGLSLDEVQVALHDAVRTRRLTMTSAHAWTVEA